jgi:PKD repeat protein
MLKATVVLVLFAAFAASGTGVRPASAAPRQVSVTITASPASGQTGLEATFAAVPSGGSMAQQQGLIYVWTFGDGTSGTGNPVKHTFQTAGTYTVVVQVSGSATATASLQYTVAQALMVTADGPYTGTIGQPVTMTATGTGLPADAQFSWDFGDGSTGTGATVHHIYVTSGQYTVKVTVTSAFVGRSGTFTTTATISGQSAAPTLTIVGPTQATAGQPVSYSVTASGAVPTDVVYTWNFGDGTAAATGSSVTHTFAAAGTYTVTVSSSSVSTPSAAATGTLNVTVSQSTPTGPTVTYAVGWNLVAGPTGTTFPQANGVLYTFQAGDTNYESQPNTTPVTGGRGYWAYFTTAATVSLSNPGTTTASVQAPANQWVMVGNPSNSTTVTVHGADSVQSFNPSTNSYVATTSLAPGHGAWAISTAGGTITVSP